LWLRRPQLSLPSLRGRLRSSNSCYSGLRRQTAEGVVRGVAYRPRQRVLLAARLECRLAAGSRPRIGDERRSLAPWESLLAIGDFCLCCLLSLLTSYLQKIVLGYTFILARPIESFAFELKLPVVISSRLDSVSIYMESRLGSAHHWQAPTNSHPNMSHQVH